MSLFDSMAGAQADVLLGAHGRILTIQPPGEPPLTTRGLRGDRSRDRAINRDGYDLIERCEAIIRITRNEYPGAWDERWTAAFHDRPDETWAVARIVHRSDNLLTAKLVRRIPDTATNPDTYVDDRF